MPTGVGVSSIKLNDNRFAGTDVDEDYWNEHRNDLYKDIPENLSGNYVWSKAKEYDSDDTVLITLYLPSVTEHHVSSDNIIHFTFDTYKLSGDINLYASYDEAKTVMA